MERSFDTGKIILVPPYIEGDGKDGASILLFADCDGYIPTDYDVISNARMSQQLMVRSVIRQDIDNELFEQHAVLTCTILTSMSSQGVLFNPQEPYYLRAGWQNAADSGVYVKDPTKIITINMP